MSTHVVERCTVVHAASRLRVWPSRWYRYPRSHQLTIQQLPFASPLTGVLHLPSQLFMGVVAEPGGQLALVTEYLERGSLWDALHPRQPQPHHQLTPERRLRIARGIAKGESHGARGGGGH